MSKNPPLVSIMIPTYNRAMRLKCAVESALNQTYPKIEILISNNSSSDETGSYLKQINNQIITSFHQEKNIGLINNWNFLLDKAAGEYCLMLSDDDELDADAIANLMQVVFDFERDFGGNNIGVVVGLSNISKKNEGEESNIFLEVTCKKLMQLIFRDELQVLPSATLLKTSVAQKKGYKNHYGAAIDLGLIVDLSKDDAHALVLNKMVCQYSIHEGNITAKFNVDEIFKTYSRLLKGVRQDKALKRVNDAHFLSVMKRILTYVISERFANGKLTFKNSMVCIYKYRWYFELFDFPSIVIKMILKRILKYRF